MQVQANTQNVVREAQAAEKAQQVNRVEEAIPANSFSTDLDHINKLSSKCKCPPDFGHLFNFNTGPQRVDETLDFALYTKMMGAEKVALRAFSSDMKELSRGELDETRDYIVAKMQKEDDPRAREILHKMYQVVDNMLDEARPLNPKPFPSYPMPDYPFPTHPMTPPNYFDKYGNETILYANAK